MKDAFSAAKMEAMDGVDTKEDVEMAVRGIKEEGRGKGEGPWEADRGAGGG